MSLPRQINAFDLLKEVVQKRNWYNNNMSKHRAQNIKRKLPKGLISYELAIEALNCAGWEIVESEKWAKKEKI